MLDLASRRGDVRVPDLGHPPPGQLRPPACRTAARAPGAATPAPCRRRWAYPAHVSEAAVPPGSILSGRCRPDTSSRCTGCPGSSRPDKTVLKDITLAFLPGAKIGVLGYNGSGKSTLLRIMAGRDNDFRGDAELAPGATVGLLEQEPALDPTKDARGNVLDGVAEIARPRRALQRARRQLLRRDRRRVRPPPGADRRRRRLEPRRDDRARHGRPALPPARRRRDHPLRAASAAASPSAGCSSPSPTSSSSTSRPTTSTPSRSNGSSATSPSTRARSSPSPTIATSSTTSPAGSSSSTAGAGSPTRATTPAGSSRSRPAWPSPRSRRSPASGRSPPSSNGSGPTPRAGARRPRPA